MDIAQSHALQGNLEIKTIALAAVPTVLNAQGLPAARYAILDTLQ
jgi:hypothetical protein